MKDLAAFEKVYQKFGSNIPDFLKNCEELSNEDDARAELARWASGKNSYYK